MSVRSEFIVNSVRGGHTAVRLSMHAAVDEMLVRFCTTLWRRSHLRDEARVQQEVDAAVELFDDAGWFADPLTYHATPPPLDSPRVVRRSTGPVSFEHLTFDSGYEPSVLEPGRTRWLAREANRTAHAWILRHEGAERPWLVSVHGAGMGRPLLDVTALRATWLHRHLGLNVLMPVLPLHGPRGNARTLDFAFPSEDVLDNIHGMAQALWEIRRILGWLQADGVPVGIHGVSLGGYAAALGAAFEPTLACVIAGVPASDLPMLFARHQLRLYPSSSAPCVVGGSARRLHRVVSPLAVRPLVPLERRFIFAGLADRLAHPVEQVRELWLHWDRPRIHWYPGNHLAFMWSPDVALFLREVLGQVGLAVPDRSARSPAQADGF
jgi:hypothetical protein